MGFRIQGPTLNLRIRSKGEKERERLELQRMQQENDWKSLAIARLGIEKMREGGAPGELINEAEFHLFGDPRKETYQAYKRITGQEPSKFFQNPFWAQQESGRRFTSNLNEPSEESTYRRPQFKGWGMLPQDRLELEKARLQESIIKPGQGETYPGQAQAQPGGAPMQPQPQAQAEMYLRDLGLAGGTPATGPFQFDRPSAPRMMFGGMAQVPGQMQVPNVSGAMKPYAFTPERRALLGLHPAEKEPYITNPETGQVFAVEYDTNGKITGVRETAVITTSGNKRYVMDPVTGQYVEVDKNTGEKRIITTFPRPALAQMKEERDALTKRKVDQGGLSQTEEKRLGDLNSVLETPRETQRWQTERGRVEDLTRFAKSIGIPAELWGQNIELGKTTYTDKNYEKKTLTKEDVEEWVNRINQYAPNYGLRVVMQWVKGPERKGALWGLLPDIGEPNIPGTVRIVVVPLEEYQKAQGQRGTPNANAPKTPSQGNVKKPSANGVDAFLEKYGGGGMGMP